jgi:ADP-ribose pyrophosphatase YjhB (NUDIX family)
LLPQGDIVSREQEFFAIMASRNVVRVSVRAVVLCKGRVLVQKPTGDPRACYAFIGGGYEVGDTFVSRLRQEFEEESNAKVVDCQYLFVVEYQGRVSWGMWQAVDHYFAVILD